MLLILATAPWNKEYREELSTLSNGQSLVYVDMYNETIDIPHENRRLVHDSHWSNSMHQLTAKILSGYILRNIR